MATKRMTPQETTHLTDPAQLTDPAHLPNPAKLV